MSCTCRNTKYLSKKKSIRIILKIVDTVLAVFFCGKLKSSSPPLKVRKILIVKPDHLGDMLLLTSVFRLIRERYKDAFIDIICGMWSKPVLDNNPYIHTIYVINNSSANRDKSGRIKKILDYISTLFSAIGSIRREKYDICLFMRSRRGNMIYLSLFCSNAYSIGHGTAGFGPLLSYEAAWEKGVHETAHFLEILRPLGINALPDDLFYGIYPSQDDDEAVFSYWRDNFSSFDKTVIVHPGAGKMEKTLSVDKWKDVIEILEKNGFKVILTGGSFEEQLLRDIASVSSSICAGLWSIPRLALFFKKSSLIITVDSLSSHIAGWSGVKTVVFFCGIGDRRQWRPLGKNIKILSLDKQCSPCESGCDNMLCMDFDVNILSELII